MICAKTGPFTNRSRRPPELLVENLGAGDVGRHQVGRELDPLEIEVEDVGQRPDQQRLGEAGHAGDQAVAAGEQRHQHLVDDVVLSDDDLAKLGEDAFAPFGDKFHAGGASLRLVVQTLSFASSADV